MTFSKMPLRPAAAGEHLVTPRSDRAPAAEAKSRPLFVKQRLPVRRHRAGRSGHRLLQRMTVRSVKLRAGEGLFCTIVVKPLLAGLEACDDRMTRSGVMFRCMLTWRGVATADVTAFGASAKMQPPAALSQTFDATCSARLGRRVDTVPLGLHRRLSEFCLFQFNAASKSFHDVCVNAPDHCSPSSPRYRKCWCAIDHPPAYTCGRRWRYPPCRGQGHEYLAADRSQSADEFRQSVRPSRSIRLSRCWMDFPACSGEN